MNKRDLIKHLKVLLEIEEKEISIEQYNYFSPEISMWRNKFLDEKKIFDEEVRRLFSNVLSENLMRSSPEEILQIYIKDEEEE